MSNPNGSKAPHWTKKRQFEDRVIKLAVSLGADKETVFFLMREEKMTMHMMFSIQQMLTEIQDAKRS
jgi:hypothetical protein